MSGVDWKAWQEEQDKRNGPNARNPAIHRSQAGPKPKKKKVLTAQDLKSVEPSPDFPDTVDD